MGLSSWQVGSIEALTRSRGTAISSVQYNTSCRFNSEAAVAKYAGQNSKIHEPRFMCQQLFPNATAGGTF